MSPPLLQSLSPLLLYLRTQITRQSGPQMSTRRILKYLQEVAGSANRVP